LPGVHAQTGIPVTAYKTVAGTRGIVIDPDQINHFLESICKTSRGELWFPVAKAPPSNLIERFMAKCGLEIAAQRFCPHSGWRAQTVMRAEFDPIRRFARFGEGATWPVHIRRIYAADTAFPSAEGELTQVIHEYDLLYSDRAELYAVLAIFGVELCINLVGPEIDGYLDWLRRHNGVSPLYTALGRYTL
jgi:hypothetical protein